VRGASCVVSTQNPKEKPGRVKVLFQKKDKVPRGKGTGVFSNPYYTQKRGVGIIQGGPFGLSLANAAQKQRIMKPGTKDNVAQKPLVVEPGKKTRKQGYSKGWGPYSTSRGVRALGGGVNREGGASRVLGGSVKLTGECEGWTIGIYGFHSYSGKTCGSLVVAKSVREPSPE